MIPPRPLASSFHTLLIGVAIFGLLTGCSRSESTKPATAAPPLTKVRFQTDWYPQVEHGGFYQALAKGFYREVGLDVEILAGGPGPGVPQKILSGAAEMAMGHSDDIAVHVSGGLPFVIVGVHMQHDPQGILLHEENPVATFPELNGKTIMAVPGSIWLSYLEAKFGVTMKLQPMNYGLAQFMADKNFIQQCYVTNEPYYVRQNGSHPKALLIAGSGYDPYRIIYTTQRFAHENPEAVRAFVAASVRGWEDFMAGDPAPAKALIAARNPQMTPEFMEFSVQAMREYQIINGRTEAGERIGLMKRSRLQKQADLLVELKIIPAPIPLEKFVRFDFLPADLKMLADD